MQKLDSILKTQNPKENVPTMTWQSENFNIDPYINIMQSELQFIAGVANRWKETHSSGERLCLWESLKMLIYY